MAKATDIESNSPFEVEAMATRSPTPDVAVGRVYHEEHFNHGVYISQQPSQQLFSDSACAPGTTLDKAQQQQAVSDDSVYGHKALRSQATGGGLINRAITNGNGDGLVFQFTTHSMATNGGPKSGMPISVTGAGPMPKWPAGHQSAAFESVAPKKALILSPPEIYAEIAHHGHEKCHYAWNKIVILSILAGFYVSFSYTTCLYVGGNMSFAPAVVKAHGEGEVNVGLFKLLYAIFGFPLGFTIIVICGAELYTSMCAYAFAAWWEGTVTILDNVRMLFITWFCNFAGCAIMACLFKACEQWDHYDATLLAIAKDKVSHPWGATLVKGIFANWLVVIAVWQANAAQDLSGKFVGIFLPISAFVALGFEHCIANQYLFTMAWFQGFDVSFRDVLWKNLIPATIGNWIGGAFFMATTYAFTYGRMPKVLGTFVDERVLPKMPACCHATPAAAAAGAGSGAAKDVKRSYSNK